MARVTGSLSVEQWNGELRWCKLTRSLKIFTLFIVGALNLGAIGYGGYRLYPFLPKWTLESVVYTPLLVGLLGGMLVHHKKGTSFMPREVTEKNAHLYSKPIMVATMIASLFLLYPIAKLYNYFDHTEYYLDTKRANIVDELEKEDFDAIAVKHGWRMKNLIRYGYFNPSKEDRGWIMQNIPLAQEMRKKLARLEEEGFTPKENAESNPQKRCNDLRKELDALNTHWKNKIEKNLSTVKDNSMPQTLPFF